MLRKCKTLLVSLVLVLAMTLPVVSSVAAQRNFTIALVPGLAAHPFYFAMYAGAKKAADELGIKLVWQGPSEWDFAKQSAIVRGLIARGDIDFLLFVPCDPKANIPDAQEAIKRGIPVITLDSELASNDALTFIASDNFKGGEIAGGALAKAIGYKGEVALMGAVPGLIGQEQRYNGFKKAIKEYPDIKLVSTQYSYDDQSKATSQMQGVLVAYPNLAGAFATSTPTGHGAAIGIRNAGKLGKVVLVSFDAQPSQIEDIKQGLIQMLVAQAPYAMGYLGVQFAHDYRMGFITEFPKRVSTGYKIITPENVDDPETAKWIYPTEAPK